MSRLFHIFLTAAAVLCSTTALGADAGWYFYVYSSSAGINTDWGQFQTTSTANEFVIEDMEVTAQGINFCVRSTDWSTRYGWSDTGGAVSSTGVDVLLASANGATGWLNLPVGTYDVTFNLTNLTVRFDTPQDDPVAANDEDYWYILGGFNSWGYTDPFTQSGSDNDVFSLTGFTLASGDLDEWGGVQFLIASANSTAVYTGNANVTTLDVPYTLVATGSSGAWANVYCNAMEAGTAYTLTWNRSTHQLTITAETAPEPSLVYVDSNGIIRWTADDSELRLFGANYCLPSACHFRAAGYVGQTTTAQKKAMIVEDLDHMRRLGFDALRLAFYGDYENTDATGALQDNEHLDLLCYLIDQASRRGIYMLLTPIVGYDSRWPENTYSSTVDTGGTGMARAFTSQDDKWAYLYANESAYTLANTYITQLLEHTNSYTGNRIKNEPNILFIEVLNEPAYSETLLSWKASATATFRTAINGYVSTIRATGCDKPVFFNVSQDMHAADIVDGSDVDGGTFAWYPFGVDNRYAVNGNGLLWTDRYEQLLDNTAYPFSKGRIVYEFDTADRNDAFTLPAMTRELRRGGIQFAALYDYDMLRTAPYNNSTRTHYFNLVYTPQKAVSAMIAAEVMRRQTAGTTNTYYPANNTFGDVRVSYTDSLAVLNDGTRFYYSNHTTDVPVAPATLTHIAGCGTSPVVDYTGTGIYFLDKTGSDTWTLEVYPDITPLSSPFKGFDALTDITSPAAVTKSTCNEQNIYINLPTLQGSYKVTPGRYTFSGGVITASETLAADSFYDSFAALSDPTPTAAGNSETTVTLVNVNDDNNSDQLWSRVRYSRTFHSPETTVETSWDTSTRKNYLTCTVESLAESADYTAYGNYPDATMSFFVGDRMTRAFTPTSFTVNARGLNSNTNRALFLVVDCDGNAWGKTLNLSTSNYTGITVNVSNLTPYKAAMLPQDWPGVNNYWFPASEANTASYASIDWSKVDRVQLSLRKDLYSGNLTSERSVGLNYITMTGSRSLTLDENATAPLDYPGSTYDLTINRSLEAGKWATICLPVWLSAGAIEYYFGAGTELAEFDSFKSGNIIDGVKQPDEFHFSTVTAGSSGYFIANKPYLIKPTVGTVSGPSSVSGKHRAASSPTPISISNQWVAAFEPTAVTQGDYTFVGATAVRAASPSTYTVNSEGVFDSDTTPAGGATIKATEAYMIADAGTPVEENGIIVYVDRTVTSVEGLRVVNATGDGRVYDLMGHCVGTSLDGLPAGIYIVNNKKVLVK